MPKSTLRSTRFGTLHPALVAAGLALLGSVVAFPASAATWQIGPNLGVEFLSSNGNTATVVSVPLDVFIGLGPGLRLGLWSGDHRHELFVDTGFTVLTSNGESFSSVSATGNYAFAFGDGSAPYLTVGAGAVNATDEPHFTVLGGGVGWRQRLGHDHGALRLEARYDALMPTNPNAENLNVVGLRDGFDLDLN
jgi:hypothetical protein